MFEEVVASMEKDSRLGHWSFIAHDPRLLHNLIDHSFVEVAVRRIMTKKARIKHYRPSALDRQEFLECVREQRGRG